MDPPTLIPLHLGTLHPFESYLTAALTLGPFVVVAVVVTLVSRRDRRAEAEERAGGRAQATREAERFRDEEGGWASTDTAARQSVQQ